MWRADLVLELSTGLVITMRFNIRVCPDSVHDAIEEMKCDLKYNHGEKERIFVESRITLETPVMTTVVRPVKMSLANLPGRSR